MKKQRFQDLPLRGKIAVLAAIGVSAPIVAAAQRDLQRRPSSEIRGWKAGWHLGCLNALGALAYFRWGRRQTLPS